MEKSTFETNMAKIKESVKSIEFKNDPMRIYASVCNIVDKAYIDPRDLKDPSFVKSAQEWWKVLTTRYKVYTRDGLIQAMMRELGFDDDLMLVNLTTGKMEIEATLKELLHQ